MTAPLRVVVVTFSPGESLEACLSSLRRATTRPLDVVLADNGCSTAPPRARRAPPTSGCCAPAATSGTGPPPMPALADLRTGWALVTNPDVRFEDGAVDELLTVAGRCPGCDGRSGDPDAGGRPVPVGA